MGSVLFTAFALLPNVEERIIYMAIDRAEGGRAAIPSRDEILARIAHAENVLTKLRIFPPDWVSESGETKQETEEKLEACIENLQAMLAYADDIDEADYSVGGAVNTAAVPTAGNWTDNDQWKRHEQEALAKRINAKFYEVGGVYVPVMQSVADAGAKWQAVLGKVMVSGGEKFSEVRFVKDENGLTLRAKPGEKMDFSESNCDLRLPHIDTVLQGRGEMKAYRFIYEKFTEQSDVESASSEKSADFTVAEYVKSIIPADLADQIENVDDFAERVADIIDTLLYLRSTDTGASELIPAFDRYYKMTPFIERKFAEFSQLVNRQMGLGNSLLLAELVENKQSPDWNALPAQGMTIVVGPRGSGKNKLVEYYAAISNRPLFRYSCSPDKEERDLTYDVELSDGEVIKVPTRILTAISTPNGILELDEINLLRPSVAKFFNALFDSDRSVFLSDQVIQAAAGVIFVGLMNPADYNGVEDLPETIDDRSNTMILGYPPLKEIDYNNGQEIFTYDEALILKDHISALEQFTDEQFVKLWDRVINGRGTVNVSPEIAKIIKDLKNIILITHRTRQTVEACKTRSGDVRMERDISLRGTIAAASFYSENHLWDADLTQLLGWKAPWTAAQYAVAMIYLPHTETYRKGRQDRQAFEAILSEGLSV